MASGTGTGTPASGSSSITLNTLRDRVRVQLENAYGFPDPLQVTTSSETLATLRDRVELHLQDSGNERWATADIDEAIEKALEEYNRSDPRLAVTSITLGSDGREIDISAISDLLRVHKVWWPYNDADPGYPPNWVQFDIWPGDVLYIDERSEPESGEKVRMWYTTPCVLNGLNGASATTMPVDDLTYLINGAAQYAARQRAVALAEELNVDRDVVQRLMDWGDEQGKSFRYGVRKSAPAWWRYAYAFNQEDIDEAMRWALGRFNEVAPEEAVTSITLSADGREVALSSITDLLRVTRVWWPYTEADPEYRPRWVRYEVWGTGSDGTLFLDTENEPQAGGVVRLWYARLAQVNGLDSASATTLPDDAETLIVTGAVGYVAEERIVEKPGWRVPRDMKEWAAARLAEFEGQLRDYARRQGGAGGGWVRTPVLDRWDQRGYGKW